jgi:ABC-2 type transport system ATP-binding protein
LVRQGTAVLVTTHYLEEAEQCNRLGFMVAGEVVMQGSPSQIKAGQPGQLIELRLDQVQQAAEILKTRLQAWRGSIFGDCLHLTLDYADREIPEIKKIVSDAGNTGTILAFASLFFRRRIYQRCAEN